LTSNHFPYTTGFEFCSGLLILSCEEAIQQAYRMSVVLLGACLWLKKDTIAPSSTCKAGKSQYDLFSVLCKTYRKQIVLDVLLSENLIQFSGFDSPVEKC
jgi:hypothetical protein